MQGSSSSGDKNITLAERQKELNKIFGDKMIDENELCKLLLAQDNLDRCALPVLRLSARAAS